MAASFIVRGDDGQEYGPVGLDELAEWVRENRAGLGTAVRADQPDAKWQPWQHYPELVALLAERQALGSLAGLVLAPMLRRMGALLIDLVLSYVLVMIVWTTFNFACTPDIFIQNSVAFGRAFMFGDEIQLELPTYYVVLDHVVSLGIPTIYWAGFIAAHGVTPGKALLKLRVVNAQGKKPTLKQALIRGFFFGLSLFFNGLLFLVAFVTPQRQAFHDVAAGTYVVEG